MLSNNFHDILSLKTRVIQRNELNKIKESEIHDKEINKFSDNFIFKNRYSYRGDLINLSYAELKEFIEELSRRKDYHPIPYAGNISPIASLCLNDPNLYYCNFINGSLKQYHLDSLSRYVKKQTRRADIKGSGGTIFLLVLDFSALRQKYLQQSEILSWVDLGCILEGMSILASVKQYNCCIHFFMKDPTNILLNEKSYTPVCLFRIGHRA
ncbi:MAG: hypothetical protein N4S02_03750 [Lactobacillus iners]|nr:hypothetical protein [Lactobacillus iners]